MQPPKNKWIICFLHSIKTHRPGTMFKRIGKFLDPDGRQQMRGQLYFIELISKNWKNGGFLVTGQALPSVGTLYLNTRHLRSQRKEIGCNMKQHTTLSASVRSFTHLGVLQQAVKYRVKTQNAGSATKHKNRSHRANFAILESSAFFVDSSPATTNFALTARITWTCSLTMFSAAFSVSCDNYLLETKRTTTSNTKILRMD